MTRGRVGGMRAELLRAIDADRRLRASEQRTSTLLEQKRALLAEMGMGSVPTTILSIVEQEPEQGKADRMTVGVNNAIQLSKQRTSTLLARKKAISTELFSDTR